VDLNPDLEPVAWLLGAWAGEGEGWYPTVADFAYREESTWTHAGKPFLAYTQTTRALDDGRPLHGERGYLRVAGGQFEFVVAHSNGVVEIETGAVDSVIALRSISVACAPGAKDTSVLDRRIWLDGEVLRYELGMTAVGQPHTPHLRATLHRV
jgi:hypothetical protein